MSSAYLGLLIFPLEILSPACVSSSRPAFRIMNSEEKLNKQGDNIQPWHGFFPNLEPLHCSKSSSNCFFLICIEISQEGGKVPWYSQLFKSIPQFVEIHTVKGFSIVNEAEVDVFLGSSCFFYDLADVGNLISGSSAFSKPSLYTCKFSVSCTIEA